MKSDPQTTLITRADAGDRWATPPLATCSYFEYERPMGTAVRITRGTPRGSLSRWTDEPHWPTVRLLAPGAEYFHQGLSREDFRDAYLADLNAAGPVRIAAALREIRDTAGQLVLLCFEKSAVAEEQCHRRIFAEWWETTTGQRVPELTTT